MHESITRTNWTCPDEENGFLFLPLQHVYWVDILGLLLKLKQEFTTEKPEVLKKTYMSIKKGLPDSPAKNTQKRTAEKE